MALTPTAERIDRLSRLSLKRVIEPEVDLVGQVGDGAVLPRELLSLAGLDIDLTDDQAARLSREEVAAMLTAGVRFEAILMAGFSLQIATTRDLTDPRVTYALHEVGEETRHSRAFLRLVEQLAPQATNPLDHPVIRAVERRVLRLLISRPALLDVLVLAGEEIPDLLQKRASEHPDTDPYLAEINRYHRMEEARHLAFARTVLPEHWAAAGAVERFVIRRIAPRIIQEMFQMFVHPGVYETVGLPGWKTWRAANASPTRVALRHQATRPVLAAVLDAGVVEAGRIPRSWRELCGVDAHGVPVG